MNETDPVLETEWVLYAHPHSISTNYGSSYFVLGNVATVCQFWNLYNACPSVRHVHQSNLYYEKEPIIAYSFFRKGIRPEWEDPVNLMGSEWGCRENLDENKFHDLWFNYLLGAIGEQIPHLVGIRAINKSNRQRHLHKIEVWMDTVETPSIQECRRSLSDLVPMSPRFSHMLHQEKQYQALEYQKRRKKINFRNQCDEDDDDVGLQ